MKTYTGYNILKQWNIATAKLADKECNFNLKDNLLLYGMDDTSVIR